MSAVEEHPALQQSSNVGGGRRIVGCEGPQAREEAGEGVGGLRRLREMFVCSIAGSPCRSLVVASMG
jgi:hypothetical protein